MKHFILLPIVFMAMGLLNQKNIVEYNYYYKKIEKDSLCPIYDSYYSCIMTLRLGQTVVCDKIPFIKEITDSFNIYIQPQGRCGNVIKQVRYFNKSEYDFFPSYCDSMHLYTIPIPAEYVTTIRYFNLNKKIYFRVYNGVIEIKNCKEAVVSLYDMKHTLQVAMVLSSKQTINLDDYKDINGEVSYYIKVDKLN